MTRQPITPDRLDDLLLGRDALWGLTTIARHLGVSRDKARTLARCPGVPIYKPEGSGSYFARRSELSLWLRGKAA